ncbi:MAG: glycosyltransferase family 4 protein, partial [Bacteroidetes bacterium]|nr:glycosyltransferase family 4 protein [Bacteroidota bacterium]
VQLTGFINQGAIVNYYAMSDALVIASQHGETWGLVVNEAMNFGLPVIASDQTGSAADLVQEGINGFRFQTGHIDQLENCLRKLTLADNEKQSRMRAASKSIVENYSYAAITRQVQQILIG